ncbi:MAG TPA: tetratricopeptide repeat protein [Phycisphaerae bacterium]|nr:tetratricopeptide repeat protein [Phycisphaerae bacterium]
MNEIQQALQEAVAAHQAGDFGRAEELYRQVLEREPENADALHLLGVLFHQAGQTAQAMQLIERAIARRPRVAGYHVNLGTLYMESGGRLDEAIASFRRAIALDPTVAEAYNNLGTCLQEQALPADAMAAFRMALRLRTRYGAAHDNLLCAFFLDPACDPATFAEEHKRWCFQQAEPLRAQRRAHGNDRTARRRLRVGYVSADFCDHVLAFIVQPLLRHHDHEAFEIHCFSSVARADEVTARFRGYADHWHDISTLSDDEAAELIRARQIDILVDLSLHMADNRLLIFARKPAPVQVSYGGYPDTTGLDAIDYRLTDRWLEPPVGSGEPPRYSAERPLAVLDSFWCYEPPETDPPVNALPALLAPGNAITFGCLNRFAKVNEAVLALWAEVLRAVARSRLHVLAPGGSVRRRVLGFLEKRGVAAERVRFLDRMPRQEYLRAYHEIDLCLDTFPSNGHTTSLDAFWMGVPVITLVGNVPVARAGLCQVMNLGWPELAARDERHFVEIAATWAGDLQRLAQMREGLRERMRASPLMDAAGFTRKVEETYCTIWRAWANAKGA